MRLFPTIKEKKELQLMLNQFRWYYNATINITNLHYKDKLTDKKSYNFNNIRDLIRKYKYVERKEGDKIIKSFEYDEDRDENPVPSWWSDIKINNRLQRGAVNKYVYSLNSAISNFKAGNISKFQMSYRTKKNPTDYMSFEDAGFPKFLRDIKSHYWFRNKDRKRVKIGFNDIDTTKKGIEIIYEKETDKYFLHYPVDRNWFPKTDKRNENQVKLKVSGDRIISLDPGVRKFLVGYDPIGSSTIIGEGANIELMNLLSTIDKNERSKTDTYFLWKQLKSKISELHWKSIYYLIENYDTILLPDFRVSQMVRSKKLGKNTKRLMYMFSFHKFKERLKYKCSMYGKKLIIVDESYTSCTCGKCGTINQLKGNEIFKCKSCNLVIDRDIGGSRNILLKNLKLK